MRLSKSAARLVQGKPLNVEERFEELEGAVNRRLHSLEDAIISMKDIIIKLHDENELLRKEKGIAGMAQDKGVIDSFMGAGKEFVEAVVAEEPPVQEEMKTTLPERNVEMERAIALMRRKFGLPAKVRMMKVVKARSMRIRSG